MRLIDLTRNIKRTIPQPVIRAIRPLLDLYVPRLPHRDAYLAAVRGRKGIEIGGPSAIFRSVLPVYAAAGSLDGANFSSQTIWEGKIRAGRTYRYLEGKREGAQFLLEATNLGEIGANSYDFVLSSNCLEHVANPLKAVFEWKRVLADSGALVLVLPNKDNNFDHRRPVTAFGHLLEDYEKDIDEHDLTHLDEILALHDLALDPGGCDAEHFRRRSLDNFHNRTLHHHVFDLALIERMLDYCGFDVVFSTAMRTDFFVLSRKRRQPA